MQTEARQLIVSRVVSTQNMRIGIHCGPVIAGVVGKSKYLYDIWGDSVSRGAADNLAVPTCFAVFGSGTQLSRSQLVFQMPPVSFCPSGHIIHSPSIPIFRHRPTLCSFGLLGCFDLFLTFSDGIRLMQLEFKLAICILLSIPCCRPPGLTCSCLVQGECGKQNGVYWQGRVCPGIG